MRRPSLDGLTPRLMRAGSDFKHITIEEFALALPLVKRLGVPFYVHAELPLPLDPAPDVRPLLHCRHRCAAACTKLL